VNLRVLSYNIHRAIGVDRRFRPDRIARVIAHHDPDVALLQEVDEGAPRSRELDLARELAERLGYPHFAVGHNVSLRRGRYGNATLSRFPIARERNIDLSIRTRKRRGCQHTRIELAPGLALEAFNLHLGLSAQERRRQLGVLLRSKEMRRVTAATPCVVGGDFNDWRSLLRRPMLGAGFDSATERPRGPAVRTYPAFSPQGGLDRIYYRGALRLVAARRCRLNLSRVASDHLPVLADFELGEPFV
jgi:endonuclease/exonuclease/phosphatase family metal-dependent hydrolase